MNFKKTFAALALAGTLFAGTAVAEPFSNESAVGLETTSNIIVHWDKEAFQNSEINVWIEKNREFLEKQFGGGQGFSPEEKAYFDEIQKKITSATFAVTMVDEIPGDSYEGAVMAYVRGNALNLEKFVDFLNKKSEKVFQSVEIEGLKIYCLKGNQNIVFAAQLDEKTIACGLAAGEDALSRAVKDFQIRRAEGKMPKVFKTAGTPWLLAYFNLKTIKKWKNDEGIERLFVTFGEEQKTLIGKINAKFESEEKALDAAQLILKNTGEAAMLLSVLAANESTSENQKPYEKKAMQMLAKILAGTTVGRTNKVVSAAVSANAVEMIELLEEAKAAGLFDKIDLPPAENLFEDGDEDKSVPADKEAFLKNILGSEYLLNGNVKKDAEVYLVLCSASWCGPCRHEMPKISKEYSEKIKNNPAVELIQISFDRNPEAMLKWAEKEKIKFPVTMRIAGTPRIFGTDVPMPGGIPSLYIFKADGTLLEEGHPAEIFENWEKHVPAK